MLLLTAGARGAVVEEQGKSILVWVEAADRMEANRVAKATVAAADLFDEETKTALAQKLQLRGKLEKEGPTPCILTWDGPKRCRLRANPEGEDFAASWISAVLVARIYAAGEKRVGSGSVRWVAEGCLAKAVSGGEAMRRRVAARAAKLPEANLAQIQGWPEGGALAEDSLTRDLRRLLAGRLFTRAISAQNRIRLQEWVAVGCPGKFWSESKEEDGAWRRSLIEPDTRTGLEPMNPEETAERLRGLAQELSQSKVRGAGRDRKTLDWELIKLEAAADPFLRPAIYRYRQAVQAGEQEEDEKKAEAERGEALREADRAVERWRGMRKDAGRLLDWYELNVPDARIGPALREWEEKALPNPKKEGRPTGLEPATARTTIWSSTN